MFRDRVSTKVLNQRGDRPDVEGAKDISEQWCARKQSTCFRGTNSAGLVSAMTEPAISEMQAANTVKRIRGYFESKRIEIEGKRAFRREARLAKVVMVGRGTGGSD